MDSFFHRFDGLDIVLVGGEVVNGWMNGWMDGWMWEVMKLKVKLVRV